MTGFRRSRKSLDNRKHGMLTCRIVVDTPMRSKTDSEATQPLIFPHVPHSVLLRRRSHPSYNTPPCEVLMAFTLRPSRRFPVQCNVTNNAGPFLKLPLASCSGFGSTEIKSE
jgi:hypothetical protein